jgi:predicted transcriptional regulator
MASTSKKSILLRLTPELKEDVRKWADKMGLTMNEFVRRAVRIFIARAELQEETVREAEKDRGKKWWEKGYN